MRVAQFLFFFLIIFVCGTDKIYCIFLRIYILKVQTLFFVNRSYAFGCEFVTIDQPQKSKNTTKNVSTYCIALKSM